MKTLLLNSIKIPSVRRLASFPAVALFGILAVLPAGFAQTNLPVLKIQADRVTAQMPPTFYGLMTEEINYSYEGGLYGELIRNRSFKADAIREIFMPDAYVPNQSYPASFPATNAPKYWNAVGNAIISLDTNAPLNAALNVSLRLDASSASPSSPAGVANGGYWGIALR